MNNSYKIKEIARLYGLCSDTLRYYEEQGLLSPKRGENRYRMFGVQDIGKLNVIRSLRELDIPLERIREYIHNRDIDSTLRLLDEEETLILSQIERLREKYEDINARKTELQKDRQIKDRQFSIRRFEARPCFQLTEDIILENDVDFVLKKLEQKYEDNIHAIGIKGFGAEMDPVSMEQGDYNHFRSVFFISDWDNYSSVIPEGEYASLFYWGAYEQRITEVFSQFVSRIQESGYELCGVPLELYHIDMNDTNRHEEYLTELQVLVNPLKRPADG